MEEELGGREPDCSRKLSKDSGGIPGTTVSRDNSLSKPNLPKRLTSLNTSFDPNQPFVMNSRAQYGLCPKNSLTFLAHQGPFRTPFHLARVMYGEH